MHEELSQKLFSLESPFDNASLESIQPISCGPNAKTWKLILSNDQQIFAKTVSKSQSQRLKFEENGLKILKKFANESFITVPKSFGIIKLNNVDILLTPWFEFKSTNQRNLGRGLALLHKKSSEGSPKMFGWEDQGFIGEGIQDKGCDERWGECFVNFRLSPQLKLSAKWGLRIEEIDPFLEDKIIIVLNEHNPSPCLVHGDLWNGNAATLEDERGLLIDPAVWWADREVDIAMTTLFGGFSNEFYSSYNKEWKLPDSANNRIKIYNLYHLLNHANIFGGSYKDESIKIIKELMIYLK